MVELSCGMKCLKMLLFAFNFIFWLCGIAVLGVGIWSRVQSGDWDSLLGDDGTVVNAANIMIAAGILVMLIGFLGCCGALKESKVLLMIYAILLILIFILEIAAGIFAYVKKDDVIEEFKKHIDTAVKNSYGKTDESSKGMTKAVDWFQEHAECCGVMGPLDWKNSDWGKSKNTTKVPGSCCKDVDASMCDVNDSYTKGCGDAGPEYIKDHIWQIGGVGIGLAFVQLFGIVAAISLCRALNADKTA